MTEQVFIHRAPDEGLTHTHTTQLEQQLQELCYL